MTDIALTLRDQAYSWPLPANAGAHRLAWWIGQGGSAGAGDAEAAIADIVRATGCSFAFVDSVLSGEIEPEMAIACRIAVETGGFGHPLDWERVPEGGWLDTPSIRATS